ncbi:hypothetical protein G3N95_12140 [Paraburkholderia sp. Tr-20389]|uniref:caspase family protein n=1 Tax=Paraburkholderia sp. Tr-20389 TaxID=2703903 RepID=UPI00197FA8D2|nr:caspase family protein [Paraburkholderia sp. Tr-20389]MBN3753692.1 hypothetical protein [Paraburkholderia sp. Tr-20389]
MNTERPVPERTLVVILGASVYPDNDALSNERFKNSAEEIRRYLLDASKFNLPQGNLLWLFDDDRRPTDLNDQLELFLQSAMRKPEDCRPLDVIVYYVGHGFFGDRRDYYLALRSLKPDAPEYSYRFQALQRTVKKIARFARKFYIIDACFSAAAAKELMAVEAVVTRVISEIELEARDDLPARGTAVLCAAGPDDYAEAPSVETYTMFTGALLDVLNNPSESPSVLSLRQVHGLADHVIRQRFGDTGVRPQIHVPEQKEGDIGSIPMFPVCAGDDQRDEAAASVLTVEHGALDPISFGDQGAIHALIVGRLVELSSTQSPLTDEVRIAWENFSPQIMAAANNYRASRGLPQVSAERPDGGFIQSNLVVDRAFKSEASLCQAVLALCRAEVAVFDLTDWDPGTMMLLGIRAVARRGLTIASIGGDFTIGADLAVPFNLQLLNLASHSEAQQEKGVGRRPWELIGGKIVTGFRDLANLPHYLDLPAFDSVRQLGVESAAYRPVQYSERILVLCPFGHEYTKSNWRRLEKELPGKVMQRVLKATGRASESPALVRLLDLKTPRLVAQTLFESIRTVDMCLVDWTNLRANVSFEAGVRMATNPLGAVHVMDSKANSLQNSESLPSHVRDMLKLFNPVMYNPIPGNTSVYDEMITRFETSLELNRKGSTNFIYAAVGSELDYHAQPAALPLVDELVRSANILESDDQESTGISPVLFHEVNPDLVVAAREAAADRRLAAWLYISRRWRPEEIVENTRLLDQFELLSSQVRRWARKVKRDDLLEEIKATSKMVKDLAAAKKALP